MSDIQELDRKSSFIFVGDLNAHHQKWLKSVSSTDCHGIAAFDIANLSGCTQLIKKPTHKLDKCLGQFLLISQVWWILWLVFLLVIMTILLFRSPKEDF